MSGVVYLLQNPSAPSQMYALWDTGRIDAFGGALPINDGPRWFNFVPPPGAAMVVTDWNGPSGYVLDHFGGFTPFGGAPALGAGQLSHIVDGVPYVGGISGVQAAGPPKYVDWSWNPNQSGQGYVCDLYGQLFHFGGATSAPRSGPRYTVPVVRRFVMQWAPYKRSVMMDYGGARNQDFPAKGLALDGYYNGSRDWARWLTVTDWGDNSPAVDPSGYLLTADGQVWEWGPRKPQDAFGFPKAGQDNQVALAVLNPTNPLELAQVGRLGQYTAYTASTPPTVIAGGLAGMPPSVVTDTTRPTLAWSYKDAQRDRQAEWQLVVWPQSYVATHNMSNPRLNRGKATVNQVGTDSTTRGIVSPVDLDNGAYRMYVRAKDTAGQWSPWANRGWSQNVPDLAGPTDLDATVEGDHINLVLYASPAVGQFALFEASDDAGLTWQPVRGAEAVPLEAVTRAIDYDIPLGLPRTYRGRLFSEIPRKLSAPSVERTVTAELYVYVLRSVTDPTLGGVFVVFDPSWARGRAYGEFQPLGSEFPVVIADGGAQSRRGSIGVRTLNRADYERLSALLEPSGTLVYRDPFGRVIYCAVAGDWDEPMLEAAPTADERTPLRHAHEHQVPLLEVARPLPVPAEVV